MAAFLNAIIPHDFNCVRLGYIGSELNLKNRTIIEH